MSWTCCSSACACCSRWSPADARCPPAVCASAKPMPVDRRATPIPAWTRAFLSEGVSTLAVVCVRERRQKPLFTTPHTQPRSTAHRFCCPRRRFGEFRRPFSPYEDPCRRPPKTDEVHLPIACKRTAPAAPAARARASTVWHLQPAQHIAMTACALLGRITLVGPVHHDLFGAIAV